MDEYRIEIKNDPVLPDIDIVLGADVYLLFGPNGCGKTTLLSRIESCKWASTTVPHSALERAVLMRDGVEMGGRGSEEAKRVLGLLYGAYENEVVTLDDFGGMWHPHTARSILATIREVAEQKNLTVIIVSQDRTILDSFREDMDCVLEMSRTGLNFLTELHDEAWLLCSDLGDAYSWLYIGSPLPKNPS